METTFTSGANNAENETQMAHVLDTAQVPGEESLAPKDGDTVTVDGKTLQWRRVTTADAPLDFQSLFGGQVDNAVVCAVAFLESRKATQEAKHTARW